MAQTTTMPISPNSSALATMSLADLPAELLDYITCLSEQSDRLSEHDRFPHIRTCEMADARLVQISV